jgi:hypothetical protein
MTLLLTRDVFTPTTTLGTLDIVYPGPSWYTPDGWARNDFPGRLCSFGFACEDEDRGLDATMPLDVIKARKVAKETAIPAGEYAVRRTWSPKFGRKVMEIVGVPGFQGIRIHPGNGDGDTAGCLLVGLARDSRKRWITRSTAACDWLDQRVAECAAAGRDVRIRIVRKGKPLAELSA